MKIRTVFEEESFNATEGRVVYEYKDDMLIDFQTIPVVGDLITPGVGVYIVRKIVHGKSTVLYAIPTGE